MFFVRTSKKFVDKYVLLPHGGGLTPSLLVNDNAPMISFFQITMMEVSPSSCWVVQSHEMFIQHGALCHIAVG